jgi:UDP-2,4-diacetamido-2,4,6-trideoxy-beta-L-altropyranose hydrolase
MKSVLFRVDASAKIGLGHLMRCLALAQHLVDRKIEVTFAMLSSTVPFCKTRSDWVGNIHVVTEERGTDGSQSLKDYIEASQFDWVILDGYQFTPTYRQTLSSSSAKLALFDDENNSGQLFADLVINGANHAVSAGYEKTASGAALCLGDEFRILRPEFISTKFNHWADRNGLVVNFGGSDPLGLTIPVLEALDSINRRREAQTPLKVNVITGAAYKNIDKLRAVLSCLSYQVNHLHDSPTISSVFKHARLALSAAGGTQFELLACHTPSILVVVADNQKSATLEAEKQGWCATFQLTETTLSMLAEKVLLLWNDEQQLIEMHQQTKLYSVAEGAEKVIEAMHLHLSI